MSSERDRAKRLADEVRAAIAEAAPAQTPSARTDGSDTSTSSSEERAARRASERAQAHLTPSVPAGARLSRVKRAAVRALRFVWREQTSFNALTLEALDSLGEGLARERRALEETGRAIDRQEAARAAWERRAAIQDGRLARLESAPAPAARAVSPGGASAPPHSGAAPALPPGVYSLFEERFRGSAEEVARKQKFYLPFLAGLPGPVLDVGCGRGEFLHLLAARGIPASGVEINPIAAGQCRAEGLDVQEGDGPALLSRRPPGSLGAVVALQVVEHWTPEAIFAFLREARRALAPGGLLIAETINTDSLSAWKAFFLDPSHVRPVPSEALQFLAEAVGFVDARVELLSPLSAESRLEESTANDAKLNRLLFGPQDYALLARAPAAPAGA